MDIPVATYRLQLGGRFRFEAARALTPYLKSLGVSHLYLSPVTRARAGSTHGYDCADCAQVSPELGGREGLEALAATASEHGLGLLLDIVPNHMATGPDNPYWMDVLAHGPASRYARMFDIDWNPPATPLEGQVLLPILGAPYAQVIERGDIALVFEEGRFHIRVYDRVLPVDIASYRRILSWRIEVLSETLGAGSSAFQSYARILETLSHIPPRQGSQGRGASERARIKADVEAELWFVAEAHAEVGWFVSENVKAFNGEGARDGAERFAPLDRLLGEQAYRLAYWRTAREDINYRRFFSIDDLVGVRVEDPRVFEATHELIQDLVNKRVVRGLRVDHVDGLCDPLGYLAQLQHRMGEAAGGPLYVVVEKILLEDELLPNDWPVCGTTGYDFMNHMGGLFVEPRGLEALGALYERHTGRRGTFEDVAYEKKKQVLKQQFPGEFRNLSHQLRRIAFQDREGRDLPPGDLRKALAEVTACMPVYRTYTREDETREEDRVWLERALAEARTRNPRMPSSVFDFLRRLLQLDVPRAATEAQAAEWRTFVRRWQQLTGPVSAKGVEDTALYVYNRLVSQNEVGGHPSEAVVSVGEFHARMQMRRARWPHTMNATSTHDTKRSEDVRARIHVLSELPEAWEVHLSRWSEWNRAHKAVVDGHPVPTYNEELLLYQTLVGAWPVDDPSARRAPEALATVRERVVDYMQKAVREAKVFTRWTRPNRAHEEALTAFIRAILEPAPDNRFLADFEPFQRQIAAWGALGSLSQVLLKATAPGVPDFYQGCELWDLSLVDPDNRRPVDFARREALLRALDDQGAGDPARFAGELLTRWPDGRIKLWVTSRLLRHRAACREVYSKGDYQPLTADGPRHEHVCAFARQRGEAWSVAVATRFHATLGPADQLPVGPVWRDTFVPLPNSAPAVFTEVLTGRRIEVATRHGATGLDLADVLAALPLALLTAS